MRAQRKGTGARGRFAALWAAGLPLLMAASAALVPACGGMDAVEFDIDLPANTYRADFGAATGELPAVACDPAAAAPAAACGDLGSLGLAAAGAPGASATLAMGCDAATARCFADAEVQVTGTVAVLQGSGLVTRIQRQSVVFVRSVDAAYTITTNTLTFDVPQIDVYVGPASTTAATDPGVQLVGSMPAVAAGATVTEPAGQISLSSNPPARALIELSIDQQLPMVFLLVFRPRLDAGAPMPAGAIEVTLAPRIRVGLPF